MKKKEIQQLVISFVCALLIYGGMMFAMSTGIINTYWSGILIVACINIVLATSLNLASGYLVNWSIGGCSCWADYWNSDIAFKR